MPLRLINMLHTPIISAFFGALFATGVIIDEKSLVPVGTLGCVAALIWWVATKFQKIIDRLEGIEKQATRMEEAAIKVANLPCMVEGKICNGVQDKYGHLKMKP